MSVAMPHAWQKMLILRFTKLSGAQVENPKRKPRRMSKISRHKNVISAMSINR